MVTVVSLGVPAVTPAGRRGPEAQSFTLSPSSSTVSWAAVKVKDLEGSPAVEGDVRRHARVVGGGGAALVGLLYGDDDCALGIGVRVTVTSTVFSVTSVVSESSLSATV